MENEIIRSSKETNWEEVEKIMLRLSNLEGLVEEEFEVKEYLTEMSMQDARIFLRL